MARIYDETRYTETVAVVAECDTEIVELKGRLSAMQEELGDNQWSTENYNRYAALQMDLRAAENKRFQAQTVVDDMLFHKPAVPESEGSPGDVFDRIIRGGANGVTAEELSGFRDGIKELGMASLDPKPGETVPFLFQQGFSPRQMQHRRQLAQMGLLGVQAAITSDAASGSNFIDTETVPTVVDTLAQYGGALQVCGRLASSSSAPMRIPQENAASQKGVMVSTQGTTATESQTPAPGYVEFGNYTFNSGWVEITNEMIDDAGFDIVGWVMSQLQRRIGRIMNEKFTVGSGTNEPNGFMTSPTELTAASATGITFPDEFFDLEYAIDEAYLIGEKGTGGLPSGSGWANRDGIIGFTFNRATEGILRKAKDTDGRPLWQPSITAGKPDMINGYPYVTNNDIATVATGAKTVAFGNFGNHKIRLQDSIALWNFWDSGTAMSNSRRLIGFSRADADNVMMPIGSPARWPSHAALKQA